MSRKIPTNHNEGGNMTQQQIIIDVPEGHIWTGEIRNARQYDIILDEGKAVMWGYVDTSKKVYPILRKFDHAAIPHTLTPGQLEDTVTALTERIRALELDRFDSTEINSKAIAACELRINARIDKLQFDSQCQQALIDEITPATPFPATSDVTEMERDTFNAVLKERNDALARLSMIKSILNNAGLSNAERVRGCMNYIYDNKTQRAGSPYRAMPCFQRTRALHGAQTQK
jgi:hypothetical protein